MKPERPHPEPETDLHLVDRYERVERPWPLGWLDRAWLSMKALQAAGWWAMIGAMAYLVFAGLALGGIWLAVKLAEYLLQPVATPERLETTEELEDWTAAQRKEALETVEKSL